MSNLVVNTWVDSLMSFLPFSMLQTLLDLQSFKFSCFFDCVLNSPKPDTPISQTGFLVLPNLIINNVVTYISLIHGLTKESKARDAVQ
jgi:hypothetical protein